MSRPEEKYACDLYANLRERLAGSTQTIEIIGAGVHWRVAISDKKRLSTIHCFHYQMTTRVGAEYCIDFSPQSPSFQGRTESVEAAIEAATLWAEGVSYRALCEEFAFVDFEKRGLSRIRQDLLQEKGFEENILEMKSGNFHSYTLNCTKGDRQTEVRYWGNNTLPHAFLHWDGTQMHEAECLEYSQIKELVEQWILRRLNPSEMQKRYTFLQTTDVAPYYERGEPIAGEFILSWESVENFYSTHWNKEGRDQILGLIRKVRATGFDHKLRAGSSLYTLILSRSRRYGLRPEQPYIALDFMGLEEMQVTKGYGDRDVSLMPIDLSPNLQTLLTQLSAYPVN